MMVSSRLGLTCLNRRRASELARPDHQRVFKQPTLLEVQKQPGNRPIYLGHLGLVSLCKMRMLILLLIAVRQSMRVSHLYETEA